MSLLLQSTEPRDTRPTTHENPIHVLPLPAINALVDMTSIPGQLRLSPAASFLPNMEHQQPCTIAAACHFPVYLTYNQWYTNTYPVWSAGPQHRCGYEQHTITPPDNNFTQIPGALQEQYPWTEQVFVNGQNRFVTIPPGRSSMCLNGIEIGCGQPQIPTVELNMDGLLEYQERRPCVTSKKKEPLTPAQRRRKAQNRIAQQAFRNRKLQREQELEAQFSASELRINFLESDNKRLKHELLLAQVENKILRKIVRSQPSNAL